MVIPTAGAYCPGGETYIGLLLRTDLVACLNAHIDMSKTTQAATNTCTMPIALHHNTSAYAMRDAAMCYITRRCLGTSLQRSLAMPRKPCRVRLKTERHMPVNTRTA